MLTKNIANNNTSKDFSGFSQEKNLHQNIERSWYGALYAYPDGCIY